MNEKRKHPRHSACYLVVLTHPTLGKKMGKVKDMSDGGVYLELESSAGLYPKCRLSAQIMGENWDSTMPALDMEVTRILDRGVALTFTESLDQTKPIDFFPNPHMRVESVTHQGFE